MNAVRTGWNEPKKLHPRSPDTPPMNTLVSAITTSIDQVIDNVRDISEAATKRIRTAIGSNR